MIRPTDVGPLIGHEVVENRFLVCAACGAKRIVEEEGLPAGWFLDVMRVFDARTKRGVLQPRETADAPTAYVCDKECAMAYIQFHVGLILTANRGEVQQ